MSWAQISISESTPKKTHPTNVRCMNHEVGILLQHPHPFCFNLVVPGGAQYMHLSDRLFISYVEWERDAGDRSLGWRRDLQVRVPLENGKHVFRLRSPLMSLLLGPWLHSFN